MSSILPFLNGLLLCSTLLLGSSGIVVSLTTSKEPFTHEPLAPRHLPTSSFVMPREAYAAMSHGSFAIAARSTTARVPNLRQHLVYYGKHGRPDVAQNDNQVHLALMPGKSHAVITCGSKRYLSHEIGSSHYCFSPINAETPFWIEIQQANSTEVIVNVHLHLDGEDTQEQFTLTEKEFLATSGNSPWEIGSLRVDGSFLVRQRTRWYGNDRFLERHGGDEFLDMKGKQRIDFGEGEEAYACYVQQGDCIVWDGEQWRNPEANEKTVQYPILYVRQIEDKMIHLDAWDVEGKHRAPLTLMKSMEPWNPQMIQQAIKCMGARTRTQYLCEVNKQKMVLKLNDWLVMTSKGWQRLESAQHIDDYVNRRIVGPLLVVEGLVKKDDKQVMVGTLFNASRTEMSVVELAVQAPNTSNSADKVPTDPKSPPAHVSAYLKKLKPSS